jgi:hypothetical protein
MLTIRAGGTPAFRRDKPVPLAEESPRVLPVTAPSIGGERAAPAFHPQVTRRQLLEVLAESESSSRIATARRSRRAQLN